MSNQNTQNTMLDKMGELVTVGARVRFPSRANTAFREGWVRDIQDGSARVDDGQQNDEWGETYSLSALLLSRDMEVIPSEGK